MNSLTTDEVEKKIIKAVTKLTDKIEILKAENLDQLAQISVKDKNIANFLQ